MEWTKRTLCLLAGLLLIGSAVAEETAEKSAEKPAEDTSSEAREIIRKVDDAIKAVNGVRYRALSLPTGLATNFVNGGEGTAIMIGWTGSNAQMFYADITSEKDGAKRRLTGGGDGDTYFIIDHENKKAYEDMDPGVMGSIGSAVQSLGMIEFVHDAPFDDELNAEKLELLGVEKFAGVDCFKIKVDYGPGQQSTWFFSTEDYLPRKRIRHFQMPEGDGSFEQMVMDLEIDPKVDPSLFKLKLPEGYELIDDFAP